MIESRAGDSMTEIMVIGFPKSGTTSLQEAFLSAKLSSAHFRVEEGYCGKLIYDDFRAGHDPLRRLQRFQCITQADLCRPGRTRDGEPLNFWPQLDFAVIEQIQAHNPDLRYLLNRRDVDGLVRSINGWGTLRDRIVSCDIPGLPAGVGGTEEELHAWISRHYERCREFFGDSDRFLDFDIQAPDAREQLSSFLGAEIPWWGVANRRSSPESAVATNGPATPKRAGRRSRGAPAWTGADASALEALRPLGKSPLPWPKTSPSPSAVLRILSLPGAVRPRVTVDVGGGLSTVFIARHLRHHEVDGGRVIAVDRDAERFATLRTHLERDGLLDRVELVAARLKPWTPPAAPVERTWSSGEPGRWHTPRPIRRALAGASIDLLLVAPLRTRGMTMRHPALVELRPQLAAGATVVFTHMAAGPELDSLTRWAAEVDTTLTLDDATSLAIGTVDGDAPTGDQDV